MLKIIKEYFAKRKAKRLEHRVAFNKIMRRFETPSHVRKDILQGEILKITFNDKIYSFMYLYSHLDEDYFLRLYDNNIVVCPSSKIKTNANSNQYEKT